MYENEEHERCWCCHEKKIGQRGEIKKVGSKNKETVAVKKRYEIFFRVLFEPQHEKIDNSCQDQNFDDIFPAEDMKLLKQWHHHSLL